MTALILKDLAVARGSRLLLSGLNGRFAAGALVALTGPNGAGKTSLLRTLAGFLKPAGGSFAIERDGRPVDDVTAHVHVLGHRDGLKGQLSARAHVRYWRALLGGQNGLSEDAALERVGLASSAAMPARMFSAGMGRRLALARLLTAPRPVWLLDEPAAALDASGKALLDEVLRAHCNAGGVVVAAIHDPLGAAATHTIALDPQMRAEP